VSQTLDGIEDGLDTLDAILAELGGDISEAEAEAAIDEWFNELGEARDAKLNGYARRIQGLETNATAKKEEERRLAGGRKRDEDAAAWMKRKLLGFVQRRGTTIKGKETRELETPLFRFAETLNGGEAGDHLPGRARRPARRASRRHHHNHPPRRTHRIPGGVQPLPAGPGGRGARRHRYLPPGGRRGARGAGQRGRGPPHLDPGSGAAARRGDLQVRQAGAARNEVVDPMKDATSHPDYARFMAKVQPDAAGCWIWTASRHPVSGYGRIKMGGHRGKHVPAHRVAYEMFVGPIPEGLVLDHLCRVRPCVNPAHLEPVTGAENTARGKAGKHLSDRTHCPQGHAYDEQNTYPEPGGGRGCRACRSEARRRHRDRNVDSERARMRDSYHRTKRLSIR
jgi:hypothetical protein